MLNWDKTNSFILHIVRNLFLENTFWESILIRGIFDIESLEIEK